MFTAITIIYSVRSSILMYLNAFWLYSLAALATGPALAAHCPYQTRAGFPATFAGHNLPVSDAAFYAPQGIAGASDGTVCVGTGQAGFSGDDTSALQAGLNQPAGAALGPAAGARRERDLIHGTDGGH